MMLYLRDREGLVVAFRNASETKWNDPHGGTFSEREHSDMTALAEGRMSIVGFVADLRLTIKP